MAFTKIILRDQVQILISDTTEVAQKIIDIQTLYPLPALILANAVAAFGPLAFMKRKIKDLKTTSLMKTSGAMKMLVVESKSNGDVRAMIGNDNIETEYDQTNFNDIPLILGIGDSGYLKIIHQINGENFGSEVQLANGDIITDLVYYFDVSEQIKTAVRTGVVFATPQKIARAYSAIFQLLPNATEADINWVQDCLKQYDLKTMDIDAYITAIGGLELETKPLQWHCSCSFEKTLQAALLLSKEEITEILATENLIEVVCDFCKTKYNFNAQDLEQESKER
ncbi:Hsp33 family molecular chaperone HslO [Candidatus Mycoplasma pogonae]